MNMRRRSKSLAVRSIFKESANDPFRPFSQHRRILCRYAPRPGSLPVGSSCTPSGRRTRRIRFRLGSTFRQPTHVRWGICLGRFTGLPDTLINPGSSREPLFGRTYSHSSRALTSSPRLCFLRDTTSPRFSSNSSSRSFLTFFSFFLLRSSSVSSSDGG
jgi:hypothetical protein